MSCALSSGGIGAPYLIIRSSVSDQPWGPKRCCTAISTLWQITQRMTSSQPGVFGIGASCAPTGATAAVSATANASALRHIDPDRMDDVPAIAEPVERARRRLDPPEAVRRARHQRVATGRGVPVGLPLAPRVAVPRRHEAAGAPRLAAVRRHVD